MAAKELQINEMFKGLKIDLFYKWHQIGKNGNEKMDEEDAAYCKVDLWRHVVLVSPVSNCLHNGGSSIGWYIVLIILFLSVQK